MTEKQDNPGQSSEDATVKKVITRAESVPVEAVPDNEAQSGQIAVSDDNPGQSSEDATVKKVITRAESVPVEAVLDNEIQSEQIAVSDDNPGQASEGATDDTASQLFALIIEDDPDAAFIYKKAMTDNGYHVEHISHGGDAQTALKTLHPNVILLDMHLPVVDGTTLLKQIRSSEHLSQTPVILVTADHSIAQSLEADVNLVLLKPATYSQVKSLVQRIMKRFLETG